MREGVDVSKHIVDVVVDVVGVDREKPTKNKHRSLIGHGRVVSSWSWYQPSTRDNRRRPVYAVDETDLVGKMGGAYFTPKEDKSVAHHNGTMTIHTFFFDWR